MTGWNYTGSGMKCLPHALIGHTVDENAVLMNAVGVFLVYGQRYGSSMYTWPANVWKEKKWTGIIK